MSRYTTITTALLTGGLVWIADPGWATTEPTTNFFGGWWIIIGPIILLVLAFNRRSLAKLQTKASTDTLTGAFAAMYSTKPAKPSLYAWIPLVLVVAAAAYISAAWLPEALFHILAAGTLIGIILPPTRDTTIGVLFVLSSVVVLVAGIIWLVGSYDPGEQSLMDRAGQSLLCLSRDFNPYTDRSC